MDFSDDRIKNSTRRVLALGHRDIRLQVKFAIAEIVDNDLTLWMLTAAQ